jgi:hypothetical protein
MKLNRVSQFTAGVTIVLVLLLAVAIFATNGKPSVGLYALAGGAVFGALFTWFNAKFGWFGKPTPKV